MAGPRGGGNREWLKPLAGRRDGIVGSHQGTSEAMNIKNPQPGFHYYYARRDPSAVQRKLNEGWRPIGSDDPEGWGVDLSKLDGGDIPELDGLRAYKDVIAMKIPEEKYAALQDEKMRRAEVLRRGTTEEYLDKGHNLASRLGNVQDDLYYARRNHEIREE